MAVKEQTKSFVLRVDAATMEALEGWAADEFRSINGQLQWIITDALRRSGRVRKPPRSTRDKAKSVPQVAGASDAATATVVVDSSSVDDGNGGGERR